MTSKLFELNMRRNVCLTCIKLLHEVDDKDPRKKSALEEYQRQLSVLDGKIAEITGKPPPIVIGLKTAKLTGESKLGG